MFAADGPEKGVAPVIWSEIGLSVIVNSPARGLLVEVACKYT